jgi:antitoxin component YwqK of YwqJK toxin-antitoxin module
MRRSRAFTALALLAAVVLRPAGSAAAEELYRSNSLGMALERIPELRQDEYRFVLEREQLQQGTEERLFRDGEKIRTTRRFRRAGGAVTEVWIKGRLSRRQEKERGLPAVEIEHREDGRTLRTEYQWQAGRLREMRLFNDGALDEVRRYICDSQGRLLQVLYLKPDGSLRAVTGFQPARRGAFSASEWHEGQERSRYYRYGDDGELELRRTGGADAPAAVTRYYREQGVLYSRTQLPSGPGEVIRRYNEQRRVTEKLTRRSNAVQRERFEYSDGRLVLRVLRSGGTRRQWRYQYTPDGELQERETYENGELQTRTVYGADDTRVVTVYRDGEPAVRIRYAGEEMIEKKSLERETGGTENGLRHEGER